MYACAFPLPPFEWIYLILPVIVPELLSSIIVEKVGAMVVWYVVIIDDDQILAQGTIIRDKFRRLHL